MTWCEQNHSHEVLKHLGSNKLLQFLCKDHSVYAGKFDFCMGGVVFKFVGNFLDAREDELGIPTLVGMRKRREAGSQWKCVPLLILSGLEYIFYFCFFPAAAPWWESHGVSLGKSKLFLAFWSSAGRFFERSEDIKKSQKTWPGKSEWLIHWKHATPAKKLSGIYFFFSIAKNWQ